MTFFLIQSYVQSGSSPKLRHNAFQPWEHVGVRGRIAHVQAIGDESDGALATVMTKRRRYIPCFLGTTVIEKKHRVLNRHESIIDTLREGRSAGN